MVQNWMLSFYGWIWLLKKKPTFDYVRGCCVFKTESFAWYAAYMSATINFSSHLRHGKILIFNLKEWNQFIKSKEKKNDNQFGSQMRGGRLVKVGASFDLVKKILSVKKISLIHQVDVNSFAKAACFLSPHLWKYLGTAFLRAIPTWIVSLQARWQIYRTLTGSC